MTCILSVSHVWNHTFHEERKKLLHPLYLRFPTSFSKLILQFTFSLSISPSTHHSLTHLRKKTNFRMEKEREGNQDSEMELFCCPLCPMHMAHLRFDSPSSLNLSICEKVQIVIHSLTIFLQMGNHSLSLSLFLHSSLNTDDFLIATLGWRERTREKARKRERE